MSSKQNHNIPDNIHLGNYEEFFILYLDGELDRAQMAMVEAFMTANPDLQTEFELLQSLKLPAEEISIDKSFLTSDAMKLNVVDEELLLFIDQELSPSEQKAFQQKLASDADLQAQHRVLMQTKLDPGEKIVYPNKEELYRHTEKRIIAFRPWMRIAAAVLAVVLATVFFLSRPSSVDDESTLAKGNDVTPGKVDPVKKENLKAETRDEDPSQISAPVHHSEEVINSTELMAHEPEVKKSRVEKQKGNESEVNPSPDEQIAANDNEVKKSNDDYEVEKQKTRSIEDMGMIAAIDPSELPVYSGNINNNPVTNLLSNRKTDVDAAIDEKNNDVADNKGSFKGFLRRATRMVEKRTGIDPTSDGQLLIGAVAFNLK